MLLQNNRDRPGFRATEGEMIVANANLNWITERRALHYPNSGSGHHTHFHQAQSVGISPFNRRYSRRHVLWNHV